MTETDATKWRDTIRVMYGAKAMCLYGIVCFVCSAGAFALLRRSEMPEEPMSATLLMAAGAGVVVTLVGVGLAWLTKTLILKWLATLGIDVGDAQE